VYHAEGHERAAQSCLIRDEPGGGGCFSYKMSLDERARHHIKVGVSEVRANVSISQHFWRVCALSAGAAESPELIRQALFSDNFWKPATDFHRRRWDAGLIQRDQHPRPIGIGGGETVARRGGRGISVLVEPPGDVGDP